MESNEITELPAVNTAVESVAKEYSPVKAGNIGLILKSGGSMIQIHASMRSKFENGLWEIIEPAQPKKKPSSEVNVKKQTPAKIVTKTKIHV